jgi:(p)ppGpp synthase/HD superfamily hydrolase
MRYSKLIQKAIDFAIDVHEVKQKHKRKGKDIPYITHVLSVGLILSRVTDDENIVSAGILHDTIEDCKPEGSVSKEIIEAEFNANVARMVNDVTEQDKSLPWFERKMASLKHIKDMEHDSQLVKSADVLHNLTELVQDLEKDGDVVWERFNASKADTIKRYDALIPELKRVWSENLLLEDLEAAHQDLKELVHETR